jgi:hypothetical protein
MPQYTVRRSSGEYDSGRPRSMIMPRPVSSSCATFAISAEKFGSGKSSRVMSKSSIPLDFTRASARSISASSSDLKGRSQSVRPCRSAPFHA